MKRILAGVFSRPSRMIRIMTDLFCLYNSQDLYVFHAPYSYDSHLDAFFATNELYNSQDLYVFLPPDSYNWDLDTPFVPNEWYDS